MILGAMSHDTDHGANVILPVRPEDGTPVKAVPLSDAAGGVHVEKTNAGWRCTQWGFYVEFFNGEDATEANYVPSPNGNIKFEVRRGGLSPFTWHDAWVEQPSGTKVSNATATTVMTYDASANFTVSEVRVSGLDSVVGATHFVLRMEGHPA